MQKVQIITSGSAGVAVTQVPHPDSQAARPEPAKNLLEGDDPFEIAGATATLHLRELSGEEVKAEKARRDPPADDEGEEEHEEHEGE